MRRRNFFQWCLGILGLAGIPAVKAVAKKADVITANGTDEAQEWAEFSVDTAIPEGYLCDFNGYRFTGYMNTIHWAKIDSPRDNNLKYIQLPTKDVCEGLFNSEGCVIWWGGNEVWKIEYVGGEQLFWFVKIGSTANYGKRIGYRRIFHV